MDEISCELLSFFEILIFRTTMFNGGFVDNTL